MQSVHMQPDWESSAVALRFFFFVGLIKFILSQEV